MDGTEGTGRSKRSREKSESQDVDEENNDTKRSRKLDNATNGHRDSAEGTENVRWRAHERAEDYIEFASNFMLFPTNELGPYGFDTSKRQYPLETISALSYLKSPLRRPSTVETWSPFEIGVFEGAIALFGKDFHKIHKEIQSKSTKEVIDFYYAWKKTSHYDAWKKTYLPPELDISPEEAAAAKKGKG